MQDTAAPNRLFDLRHAAGDSRVAVAHALGFKSAKQIERWENDGHEIPTRHARVLAARYGVSMSYLLCDESEAA